TTHALRPGHRHDAGGAGQAEALSRRAPAGRAGSSWARLHLGNGAAIRHNRSRRAPARPSHDEAPRGLAATMHIQDIFQAHATTFSFEFFPPKTEEGFNELFATIARLQELKPSFVSVTYGAGGSTRERTHDLVVRIHRETTLTAVSHLTCVCHCRE